MLIDDNCVSIESGSLLSAGGVAGQPVALTGFSIPGRQAPIAICCRVLETAAGGTSITLAIRQSDTQMGSYTDAASLTVPLAELKAGARIGFRWLPRTVTKPWIRFTVTPTGTFTAGRVFAALVREDDLPYESGLYIDKGAVQG